MMSGNGRARATTGLATSVITKANNALIKRIFSPPYVRIHFLRRRCAPGRMIAKIPAIAPSELRLTLTPGLGLERRRLVVDVDRVRCASAEVTPEVEGELVRSEEHTSELQSLAYLVCRLL